MGWRNPNRRLRTPQGLPVDINLAIHHDTIYFDCYMYSNFVFVFLYLSFGLPMPTLLYWFTYTRRPPQYTRPDVDHSRSLVHESLVEVWTSLAFFPFNGRKQI